MLTEILSCVAAVILASILLVNVQNRRLKRPPGPPQLPIIGHFHLLGPLIHHAFKSLSSRYGPLIFLKLGSVPCVVADSPEMAKELLKSNDIIFSSRKHTFAVDTLTYSSSFAFAPYGPYWRLVKKLSTFELLGNRMLQHFLPLRAQELLSFLHVLHDSAGRTVNMTEELIKLSNNVISQMMFGVRLSATDSQAGVARGLVREVTELFGEFNLSDFIWMLKNVDMFGLKKRVASLHERYDDFLEQVISNREIDRKKNPSEKNDFIGIMLDYMDREEEEVQITRKHIKALVLDFLTAATDTTAITLEWALAELVNNPRVLTKAREEIDAVVGTDRVAEERDCVNLPYLQAIIKETFRLHPPIPMIIRKAVEKCEVNGHEIPEGSVLFVNIWSMARNPKHWDEPLQFRPERFIESTEAMDIKGQTFKLLPFGTGRRSCPGVALAMQEVPVTLAAMIQCFEWRVPDSDGKNSPVDMSERPGLTAPRSSNLVLQPVPRVTFL